MFTWTGHNLSDDLPAWVAEATEEMRHGPPAPGHIILHSVKTQQ